MEKNLKIGLRMFLWPELPKERNVVIVMDHAKYHSRLIEKTPLVNMKKDYIIKFIVKHNKDIPNPVPTKPVLLEKIRKRNVPKQYVIDLEDKKLVRMLFDCLI